MNSCFVVCLALPFFFIVRILTTEAAPEYFIHDCPNTTLFASNSTYQSNLNTLLSSLSSATTNSTNGFVTATAGQNPPDQAYGLFLCRGDLDAVTCSDCMATGRQDILQRCPNQRVSIIWYDQCMLRYSNQSIFSVVEEKPAFVFYNIGSVTDWAKFVQVWRDHPRGCLASFGKEIRDWGSPCYTVADAVHDGAVRARLEGVGL